MTTTSTTTNNTAASSTLPFKALPFQGYVFFNPWVTSYTGSKKLTPQDLGIDAASLPPQDLASLGAMHTCDPKKLQPFETARNAQAMACLEFGTRRLGGFAVPASKALDVAARLDEIKDEFYANKTAFIADFITTREKWISAPAFTKWTDSIRKRLHSVGYVDARIQCGWEAFTVGPLTDLGGDADVPSPLAAGALRVASGICDSILDEISTMASALIKNSFNTKDGAMRTEVTQKILRPIRRMQDKIHVNSFADPRLKDVFDFISRELGQLPTEGKMDGKDFERIYNLALRLSDPARILSAASSFDDVESVELDAAAVEVIAEINGARAQAPIQHVDDTPVFDECDTSAASADAAPSQPSAAAPVLCTGAWQEGELTFDEA